MTPLTMLVDRIVGSKRKGSHDPLDVAGQEYTEIVPQCQALIDLTGLMRDCDDLPATIPTAS